MASLEREYTFTRFEEICKKYSYKTALIYLGERFTYGRLETYVHKFAKGLSDMGVKPQDRVMLYISNCPQWIIANFAINRIGAVTVPVSPIYTAFEIEYMIQDAGIETVICLDTNFVYVKEVMERTNLKRVIVTNLVDFVSPFKRVVGHLFDKIPIGKVEKGEKIFFFKDIVTRSVNIPPPIDIDPNSDLAYIMYTGGTTGFPKGVPGNHIGEITYIRDIMDDVIKDFVDEGKDAGAHGEPPFPYHGEGFFHRLRFQLRQYRCAHAHPGGGPHALRHREVQDKVDAWRPGFVQDDAGE